MKRTSVVCLVSSLCLVIIGCSSPEEALSPSPTVVTIATPAIVSPVADEQWGWLEQPVVLTLTNAVITGTSSAPITYEFEVAKDAAFTEIVFSAKAVAQGSDGRTKIEVDRQDTPALLHWRARATNGTVTSSNSTATPFEIEGQGCHIPPAGYEDPSGNPLSEEYAEAIIYGCGEEFPHTLAVFSSEGEAELAAEELLLRTIWHLKLAGFDAARQRNPSLAISKDKLCLFIRGTWRAYDIYSLGLSGVPNRITGLGRVGGENPQPNDGIPD